MSNVSGVHSSSVYVIGVDSPHCLQIANGPLPSTILRRSHRCCFRWGGVLWSEDDFGCSSVEVSGQAAGSGSHASAQDRPSSQSSSTPSAVSCSSPAAFSGASADSGNDGLGEGVSSSNQRRFGFREEQEALSSTTVVSVWKAAVKGERELRRIRKASGALRAKKR